MERILLNAFVATHFYRAWAPDASDEAAHYERVQRWILARLAARGCVQQWSLRFMSRCVVARDEGREMRRLVAMALTR